LDNLQRIAHRLAKRALENSHDPTFYSPFARSAKRSLGINICGKKKKQLIFFIFVLFDEYGNEFSQFLEI
jgi:hypothetical protein